MMINKMNRTTNNAKPPANTSPISKSTSYKNVLFFQLHHMQFTSETIRRPGKKTDRF